MEIIGIIAGLIIGYIFFVMTFPFDKPSTVVKRINDKSWIVNGQFVSFEEDTPFKRELQEKEDLIHYHVYRSARDRQEHEYEAEKIKYASNPNMSMFIIKPFLILSSSGCYMIYNHKTAKYNKGDMYKLMEAEYQKELANG